MLSGLARASWLCVATILLVACAPQVYRPDTPSAYRTAAGCVQSNQDRLYATGIYAGRFLTVATGDPALPPWWDGGTTEEHPEFTANDPHLGRGFEGAVTFEAAERLGFADDQVRIVPIGFDGSLGPGETDFDFLVQQLSPSAVTGAGLDVSEGYLDVDQAVVSLRGTPIATASSLEELRQANFGGRVGSAGLERIRDDIRPDTRATVYDDLEAAMQGLRNGRVDAIVVDLPSASFITDRMDEAVIVGRLPAGEQPEHFAMAFDDGSPFVECMNLALREMRDDGTLERIFERWLAHTRTDAPILDA